MPIKVAARARWHRHCYPQWPCGLPGHRNWHLLKIAAIFLLVASQSACGAAPVERKGASTPEAAERESLASRQEEIVQDGVIEKLDLNGDRVPDVVKRYKLVDDPAGDGKGGVVKIKVLVRKDIDVNFDRKADIVEVYTISGLQSVKEREEFDLDFDGRVDEIRKYKGGYPEEIAQDQDRDGKIDTWMQYQLTKNEDGKDVNRLIERRRDHNADGLVDVWEYYVKGVLQKIGRDGNGDGKPDQFTRVDEKQR